MRIALAATLVAMSLTAFAETGGPKKEPAASAAPRPVPPELAQMNYFVGKWTCAGKADKSHLWPEHKTSSVIDAQTSLDKYWLFLSLEEHEDVQNSTPLRSSGYWGYDSAGKNYVRIFATNFGGWGLGTSPGWQGEKLVWTGEINQGNGKKLQFRHTITRTNEKSFSEFFEVQTDGKWVRRGGSTCTKP